MLKLWVVIFCFITINCLGQYTTNLKLSVISGQKVSFVFNRFEQFDNGISKTNFTQIKVFYNSQELDGDPYLPSQGWRLYVRVDESSLSNYFGSETLPLDVFEIEYSQSGGTGMSGNIYPIDNSSPGILIGEWINVDPNDRLNATSTITLSYNCGGPIYSNLASETDGEYFVNLEFEVVEIQ